MDRTTGRIPADRQDDAALVGRILGGETQLFGLLAARYGAQVLHLSGRLLPSPEDAEEAAQDALVEAYRSLGRFDRRKASFPTWLMRIAYHTALKHYRSQCRTLATVDLEPQRLEGMADAEVDALLDDTRADRIALMERAIALLKPDDQMLLSFRYFDNRPIRDIALITEQGEPYLRSRLQWIRKRLAALIINLEKHEKE